MKELKLGIVGLDTSHSPAFCNLLNDPANEFNVPGAKVVKAFPGGSQKFSLSRDRVGQYTADLKAAGIEIVDSIAGLDGLDGIFLESCDGDQHLEQFAEVAKLGVPVFIDKPLACHYDDARKIVELAHDRNIPMMTASSIRYAKGIEGCLPEDAKVFACEAMGPMAFLPDYRDYFWYGIHSAELLFSFMGAGCKTVQAFSTDLVDAVVGVWEDGRIGKLAGNRVGSNNFACSLTTDKGHVLAMVDTSVPFYAMLLRKVIPFFQTGVPAISNEESLQIIAFLEAVSRSRAAGGAVIDVTKF